MIRDKIDLSSQKHATVTLQTEDFMNVLGIVKTFAGKFSANHTYNSDDVEQELLCHLWRKKDHIYYGNKIHWGKVKKICINKTKDLVRGSAVRNHLHVDIQAEDISQEDRVFALLELEARKFSSNFVTNPYEETVSNDLVYHICDYAESQGTRVIAFISEFVSPSKETAETFAKMMEKFPTYNKFHMIPPHALGRILNYSKREVSEIMDNLRCYIESTELNKM